MPLHSRIPLEPKPRCSRKLGGLIPLAISLQLLSLFATSAFPENSPLFHFDQTNILHPVQSKDGSIWAIKNGPSILLTWDGSKWAEVREVPHQVRQVLPVKNSLYLLTEEGEPAKSKINIVSEGSADLASLELPSEMQVAKIGPRLWKGPDERVWLTGKGASIYRLVDNAWERMFDIKDAELWQHPGGPQHFWCPIRLEFASDGTVWAWSDAYRGGTNGKSIRGLVRIHRGRTEYLKDIPGLPIGAVFFVGSTSEGLAVSMHGRGAFLVGEQDGVVKADLMSLPEAIGADTPTYLFDACGSLWCFSDNDGKSNQEPDSATGMLWQRSEDGTWIKRMQGLDVNSRRGKSDMALGVSAAGLWIGTQGKGLGLISGERTLLLDWRVGFPLSGPDYLFVDPYSGRVVAIEDFRGTATFDRVSAAELIPPATPRKYQWRMTSNVITQTPDGSIFYKGPRSQILEWSGNDFVPIEFPGDTKQLDRGRVQLATDTLNRLWVIPHNLDEKAFVRDVSKKEWILQAPYRELLAEAAKKGEWQFTFAQVLPRRSSKEAMFGSEGCAVVISKNKKLEFYDGEKWLTLEAKDITQDTSASSFHALDVEIGTRDILVCIDNRYWMKLDKNRQWQKIDSRGHSKREIFGSMDSLETTALDFGELDAPDQKSLHVISNREESWQVSPKGELLNFKNAAVRSWFPPDEPTPFFWRPSLRNFLKDKAGNYLMHYSDWLVLVPGKPGSFWQ